LKPRYKLLVIDIDGTLLGKSWQISAENLAALSRARAAGVQICISTGRALKSSSPVLEQLALDNIHIFFDGALVSTPDLGEIVSIRPIATPVVREMVAFARSRDMNLELFSATHYYTERESWSTGIHRRFFELGATITNFDGLWERESIVKGGLFTATPEEEVNAALFRELFAGSVQVSQGRAPILPNAVFNNLLSPEVSKGKALETLAARLGISREEVMAVGDGSNDISLLGAAGLGVAMGNARQELKEIADHITLNVEEHGLAAAIDRFLL